MKPSVVTATRLVPTIPTPSVSSQEKQKDRQPQDSKRQASNSEDLSSHSDEETTAHQVDRMA